MCNLLGLLPLFCGGGQLSRQSFIVAQDTCAFTLFQDCGHQQRRPPLNVIGVTGCFLMAFTPVLSTDHSGHTLISGLNSVAVSVAYQGLYTSL